MSTIILAVLSSLFVISHIGLSADAVRPFLIKKLGEKLFSLVYALIALLTLGGAIFVYVKYNARGTVLWSTPDCVLPVVYLLMLLSYFLIFQSFANPSPIGMEPPVRKDGAGAADIPEPRGVLRITAHPMNMAFALFGLAHIIASGTVGNLFFFGMFLVLGLAGAYHQNSKKASENNEAVNSFLKKTGVLPFAAIIRKKNKLAVKELSPLFAAVAVAAYVVTVILH